MNCFVYVLGCRHKGRTLTYVGWTNDVPRRLAQHNAGKGARTTRGRAWVLGHFDAEIGAEQMLRLYGEIAGRLPARVSIPTTGKIRAI